MLAAVAALAGASASARAANSAGTGEATGSVAQRVQPCTTCHGERGHATSEGYFPRIAGKPAGYLFNQMVNFRAGRRHFPMMVYFMGLQGDASMRQMAAYFAAQQVAYPAPESPQVDAALLARGRQLVTQGDPAEHIPACTACHGPLGRGNLAAAYPALRAQHSVYTVKQLNDYAKDTRYPGASAQKPATPNALIMATIAKRLTAEDIRDVASYVQGMR